MTPTEPDAYIPLPAGLVDPATAGGRVFDELADAYDAVRPDYPAPAVALVADLCRLEPASHVLEIGCGTGKATRFVAQHGCAVRCLEPGPRLAALARRNLAAWRRIEVVEATFEAADEPAGTYDTVVSATAFHWVDPHVGYVKAARVLRPGGHLALLTNAHAAGGSEDHLARPVRALHRRLAPEVGEWRFPTESEVARRAGAGGDIAAVWSRVDRKFAEPPPVDALFESPAVATFPWTAAYDRDTYLDLLATQSSYALLPDRRRAELLDGIGALVDERLAGTVTKRYVCVVAVAAVRT